MADVNWYGPQAMDHVRGRAVKLITRAAITVQNRAKELLSIAGTAQRSGQARNRKGQFKGQRIYGANPSKPGEPPHKQTNRVRASVTYEVDPHELTARVGTNVAYGRHLELGTRRGLAPRPWLRRALAECQGKIASFLSQIGGDTS
jgi:hypothetical protein